MGDFCINHFLYKPFVTEKITLVTRSYNHMDYAKRNDIGVVPYSTEDNPVTHTESKNSVGARFLHCFFVGEIRVL